MAGLESIALAVAHLERADKASDDEASPPGIASVEASKDNSLANSPPQGSPFQATPRLVSTDIGSKNIGGVSSFGGGKEGDGTKRPFGAESRHTIQNGASTMTSEGGTTHWGRVEKVPQQTTMGACGRAVVIDSDRNWNQRLPISMNQSSPTNPEQYFRHQISQKILLKCKEEDGPSDHLVAHLLARIAAVTDDLELLFRLMQELCEHGHREHGSETPVPGTDEEITDIGRDDVLSGRGGETNHHYGNVQYRRIVKACQPAYLVAKRRDKPNVAAAIVQVIRSRSGRFLKKKNSKSTSWYDVGNVKAREKSSQALREGAPELRNFVTVDANRRTVALAPVAKSASPRSSLTVESSDTTALKSTKVEHSATKSASKAPVVAKKGEIRHSAFLQAMQHYKNLYGKPAAEESPTQDGKGKASEKSEEPAPPGPSASSPTKKVESKASKDAAPEEPAASSPAKDGKRKASEGPSLETSGTSVTESSPPTKRTKVDDEGKLTE